jgi:eukaryotic-like serine/threonine-protein kinase
MRVDEHDRWGLAEGDPISPDLTAIHPLGGGSAYEVYLAFDELTYGPVVVKLVRPDQVDDPSTLRGLRREVDALSTVNHPVVARGLRAVIDGPQPHVVLEALDGPRLSTLLRRHGPLPPQQYLPLGIELASALHYLRRVGLVHLDVKPSNVVMGAPARLIDLSVARPIRDAERLDHPVGTDAYMAPEQCLPGPAGTPGPASDVFGAGATLFHAIAGYRPYDDGEPDGSEPARRFPQLRDLAHGLPERVPADVAKVVLACLEPDPADRPLPRELAEGLEPALDRTPRGRLAGFRVR